MGQMALFVTATTKPSIFSHTCQK